MTIINTILAAAAAAIISSLSTPEGDRIPDFSKVGYMWGDKPIPTVKVRMTLNAPKDGADATQLIQDALDNVRTPGAVLLKAGTYNIDGVLAITRPGVVLRGEGDKTIVFARGKRERNLLRVGSPKFKTKLDKSTVAECTDAYTPLGAEYLTCKGADKFDIGSRVVVLFEPNQEWSHAIWMDRIEEEFTDYGVAVENWKPEKYKQRFERIVTKVDGDKLYLENSLPIAVDLKYGRMRVYAATTDYISDCGVEDILFVSDYDSEIKRKLSPKMGGGEYCSDEHHALSAVAFEGVEHCWARNLRSKYFSMSLVTIKQATNISVLNCSCEDPVSIIEGSRRYAFCIQQAGALCLFKDCVCYKDRHCFVTNGPSCGPNVFLDCKAVNAYTDIGPHMRWGMGTLYDRVTTDYQIRIIDRGAAGHGHGMAGVNNILWNCEAAELSVENPRALGKNYAVGCIGKKVRGRLKDRPDGEWVSFGQHVEPASLYYYQLEQRRQSKIKAVPSK